MKKRFAPHFSNELRLRERNERLAAELAKAHADLAAAQREITRVTGLKDDYLRKLLDTNFEARVAKGCYTHCPVGKLKP